MFIQQQIACAGQTWAVSVYNETFPLHVIINNENSQDPIETVLLEIWYSTHGKIGPANDNKMYPVRQDATSEYNSTYRLPIFHQTNILTLLSLEGISNDIDNTSGAKYVPNPS